MKHRTRVKSAKKVKKAVNKPSKKIRKFSALIKKKDVSPKRGLVLPKRLPIESRRIMVVYGMKVDPELIMRSAIEAYNKKRYTVHDLRLTEYIPDPKFRNLMVKIAVLDRVEEELHRIYPHATIMRPNTVTVMAR